MGGGAGAAPAPPKGVHVALHVALLCAVHGVVWVLGWPRRALVRRQLVLWCPNWCVCMYMCVCVYVCVLCPLTSSKRLLVDPAHLEPHQATPVFNDCNSIRVQHSFCAVSIDFQ